MFEPLIMYYLDQTGSYQCFEEATLHHTVVGGRTQQQAAVPISTSAAEVGTCNSSLSFSHSVFGIVLRFL